jgi:CRP-like cAMP-binding protein
VDDKTVELPAETFERLVAELARHNDLLERQVRLLAQIAQITQRELAQAEGAAKRVARRKEK